MSDFEVAVNVLLKDEGGAYNPQDEGRGPSKWGVTLETAREIHPSWTAVDIQNLDRDGAMVFYRDWAWTRYRLGEINDQEVATKLLDLGVNIGMGLAVRFLQEAVGVAVDGVVGPATVAATNSREPNDVIAAMQVAGKGHYDQEIRLHPHLAVYREGWMARLSRRYTFA